jgi:hypothetical protein
MRPVHWLAVTALVVFGVVAVLLWRGCSGGAGDHASGVDGVRLVSPELDVRLVEVRRSPRDGYVDWACIFECAERSGCRADVELEVVYRTPSGEAVLTMAGRFDVARGERMRIGRADRTSAEVVGVETVTVAVSAPFRPDAPPPTPVF